MNNEVVSVQWRGPFSFYGDGDFRSHRECEDAAAKGVYLWTVRGAEERVDRVWYPGKASDKRGLSARLNDDLRYCLRGKGSDYGCLIDVDKLLHHGISSQSHLSPCPKYEPSPGTLVRVEVIEGRQVGLP